MHALLEERPHRRYHRLDPALPLERLEALADALLDFQGPADLSTWLTANDCSHHKPHHQVGQPALPHSHWHLRARNLASTQYYSCDVLSTKLKV